MLHLVIVADPPANGACGPESTPVVWESSKNGVDRTEHCTFKCGVNPPNDLNNTFYWEVYRPLSGTTRASGHAEDREAARACAILAAEAEWIVDYCGYGKLPPVGPVATNTERRWTP